MTRGNHFTSSEVYRRLLTQSLILQCTRNDQIKTLPLCLQTKRVLKTLPTMASEHAEYLDQVRTVVRRKLRQFSSGYTEVFTTLNRKGDGYLDVYELAFGLQKFGLKISEANLVEAYDMTDTQNPYMLTLREFTQRVYGGPSRGSYGDSAAYDGDRVRYKSAQTPEQEFMAMHHRRLRRAAGREDGTYDTTGGGQLVETVIATLNNTHLKMKRIFQDIDVDNSGKISPKEFASGLIACGLSLSEDQVLSIFNLFDNNGDGELSYHEFIRLLGHVSTTDHRDDRIREKTLTEVSHEAKGPSALVAATARRAHLLKRRKEAAAQIGLSTPFSKPDYNLLRDISDAVYASRHALRKVFRKLDKSGSGGLSVSEAHAGFKHLGVTLSKEDVKNIVNAFDTNGDGELRYNEFVKMLAASAHV